MWKFRGMEDVTQDPVLLLLQISTDHCKWRNLQPKRFAVHAGMRPFGFGPPKRAVVLLVSLATKVTRVLFIGVLFRLVWLTFWAKHR